MKIKFMEEFNAHGQTSDGLPINGKVTVYSNAFSGKSFITSTIDSIKQKIQQLPQSLKIYNKDILKKVVALSLIGTIAITSLTGCSINGSKQEVASPSSSTEQAYTEPTQRVTYKVQLGDNLWDIASMYYDNDRDIGNEVNRICSNNNITAKEILPEGKELKLDVPYSKLGPFGYIVSYTEPSDWDKMEYFITQAFDNANPSPDNLVFERDRKYVFEGTETEPGLLIQIATKKSSLEEMEAQKDLYGQEAIDKVNAEITSLYEQAVKQTETTTYKVYGTDYVLQSVPTVTPIDNIKTKTIG